jgi:hypothetical protein
MRTQAATITNPDEFARWNAPATFAAFVEGATA